jgi:hypothetical protein
MSSRIFWRLSKHPFRVVITISTGIHSMMPLRPPLSCREAIDGMGISSLLLPWNMLARTVPFSDA